MSRIVVSGYLLALAAFAAAASLAPGVRSAHAQYPVPGNCANGSGTRCETVTWCVRDVPVTTTIGWSTVTVATTCVEWKTKSFYRVIAADARASGGDDGSGNRRGIRCNQGWCESDPTPYGE